jgi:hypothetical protein
MSHPLRSHKVGLTLVAGILGGFLYTKFRAGPPPQRPLAMHDATTLVPDEGESPKE